MCLSLVRGIFGPTVPTGQPSRQPSQQPTKQPSGMKGTDIYNTVCFSTQYVSLTSIFCFHSLTWFLIYVFLVGQPTMNPSRQPTNQPSRQPSGMKGTDIYNTVCFSTQYVSLTFIFCFHSLTWFVIYVFLVGQPTMNPSRQPSSQPSAQPVMRPSSQPSQQPTMQPSGQPSRQPTSQPSQQPSAQPSMRPSRQPSGQPTHQPTRQPTSQVNNDLVLVTHRTYCLHLSLLIYPSSCSYPYILPLTPLPYILSFLLCDI